MRLTLKRRKDGALVLSPSSLYRASFAVLLVLSIFVLLFGVLFNAEESLFIPGNAAPFLFVFAVALALLYNDSWVFDVKRGYVESRFGLLLLCRRRRIPMSDVASVRLSSFIKGRSGTVGRGPTRPAVTAGAEGFETGRRRRHFMPTMIRLELEDLRGSVKVLDTAREIKREQFRLVALKIADECGVRFVEE